MNSKKLKHWIAVSITGTIIATMSPLPASAEDTRFTEQLEFLRKWECDNRLEAS